MIRNRETSNTPKDYMELVSCREALVIGLYNNGFLENQLEVLSFLC